MFEDRPKPVVLMILDGWGTAPAAKANAIELAKTPNLDGYVLQYPVVTLQASGESVGLSWGEMGNSEVGHLSLGSGTIIYQSLPRITKAIADNSFYENEEFIAACKHAKDNNSSLHMIGLLSDGGIHSYNEHLYALLEVAKQQEVENVYIHIILDGRDTSYNAGEKFIAKLESKITSIGIGKIATISGRYYAMDRDNHWERITKAYDAMVNGKSINKFKTAADAIKASYEQGVYDEEFIPVVIENDKSQGIIKDKDSIICFNYRADRVRQLTKAFVLPSFDKLVIDREYFPNIYFVAMTEYEKDLPIKVAFPPIAIEEPLAKVISQAGLKQLHIAETEKYAHVTFFFNGGKENEYEGEDRVLIASPRIASYDEEPKMSADKVTEAVLKEIKADKYDFIVLNFANADMVGHTGNIKATIEAIEYIDESVGRIVDAVLESEGVAMITADHGNAEELFNLQTGEMVKEHSVNPVPLYILANELKGKAIIPGVTPQNLAGQVPTGILSDVAPTILKIMKLKKPDQMTGTSLI
ncbi:2,3-bisphosphoglycerate-independent phosphoglycerate mutase [Patescibacteria group bacterium]|nr:2,3-bisphosphoglycerate-independent phosphoglycerate mutase [Patescibacteria group bacterium]